MDNRAYMYGYTNNTWSGNTGNVVTGFSGAGTPASPYKAVAGPATDILGYSKMNKYRVFGYIGQLNYDFSMGKIRLGGWYEYAVTDRHNIDFDLTTGTPSYNEKFNNGNGTPAQNALPPISQANLSYVQHSKWNQYQLFAEFEFRPIASLAITPGVKYVHFNRSIDAAVNQKSRLPLDTSATWTKALPFLTVNWQAMNNWSFYGQYAQGMYVPDLSSFYSSSGQLSTALDGLKPQTTTNYQIGTVWHGSKISVDADGYIINVNNKIGSCTTVGCDTTLLVNIGQVRYKGVEGQVSYMPVTGLTLFANGSYNYARSVSTGAQVAKAPFSTAAAGFIYRNGGFRLSFNQKYTGPQYATEFNGNPNLRLYRIKPYSIGDFAISQEIGKNLRLGVTVNNVFNSRAVTAIANSSSGAPTVTVNGTSYQNGYGQADQFNYLPPRSFQVSARLKF
jgi:iron complex outermembrane receptor protein